MLEIAVDVRCIQDPHSYGRGIGLHSAWLILGARPHLADKYQLVAVEDSSLPPLRYPERSCFNKIVTTPAALEARPPAAFLQLATHTNYPPARFGRLLGNASVLKCGVIYDFIPWELPGTFLTDLYGRSHYLGQLAWTRGYDWYFPISEHTASGLRKLLSVPRSQMVVTGACLRPGFAIHAESVRNGKGGAAILSSPYFLAVGAATPHKNVVAPVIAHARLTADGVHSALVIAGRNQNVQREHLTRIYQEHGGSPKNLVFQPDISDEELAALYTGAAALVAPAYSEGFCLPIVEAIACGCPVLAANRGSMPELTPQRECLFEPDDHERLRFLMSRMVGEPGWRPALFTRQQGVIEQFTAEKVAGRLWEVVIRELEKRPAEAPYASRKSKPVIAIITTYPPDRGGLARHTAESLAALSKHARIHVYTSASDAKPVPGVEKLKDLSVRPYLSAASDRVLSVVGNTRDHMWIVEYLRAHGSACLAHDGHMADLYWRRLGAEGARLMAERELGRPLSAEEYALLGNAEEPPPTLFFSELLASAAPLIVHSRVVQDRIEKLYGCRPDFLPFCVTRHFAPEEITPVGREGARRALGFTEGEYHLVCMGSIKAANAPLHCIEAVRMLRDRGVPAQLHFAGRIVAGEDTIRECVETLGLEDSVHLQAGRLDEEKYRLYLRAADGAVQLRRVPSGTPSSALMDCISAGLPTVTSEDLAASVEAPDYVTRLSDSINSVAISEALTRHYDSGISQERRRPTCEAFCQEHGFDAYARHLMELLGLEFPN